MVVKARCAYRGQRIPSFYPGALDHISEEFGVVKVERIFALHTVNGEEFGERKDGSQSHLECAIYF
jgi:hypothetical protein